MYSRNNDWTMTETKQWLKLNSISIGIFPFSKMHLFQRFSYLSKHRWIYSFIIELFQHLYFLKMFSTPTNLIKKKIFHSKTKTETKQKVAWSPFWCVWCLLHLHILESRSKLLFENSQDSRLKRYQEFVLNRLDILWMFFCTHRFTLFFICLFKYIPT